MVSVFFRVLPIITYNTLRSGTLLIYRAIPVWFVRVQPIIDQLVENNNQTSWYPFITLR